MTTILNSIAIILMGIAFILHILFTYNSINPVVFTEEGDLCQAFGTDEYDRRKCFRSSEVFNFDGGFTLPND